MQAEDDVYDLLIIGGGINGAGIACDAAGRGLKVVLCEQDDLGSATSSASSKLVHGGLRYLEHYEFRLVRESLRERDVLLGKAPHMVGQREFVLPHYNTWRPAWMVRLGLFLYDFLAQSSRLPSTRAVNLTQGSMGAPLKDIIVKGFVYSDCWVDDSRLVVVNAMAAAEAGARILTRTRLEHADRKAGLWLARLKNMRNGEQTEVRARAIVNAAGPWAEDVLNEKLENTEAVKNRIRLVKGSHLVVPRLYEEDHAYILLNPDGRVVFVLPFQNTYSLLGTTEVVFDGDPADARMAPEEARYICDAVNGYFAKPVSPDDAVWSFSGVRPLFDDDADNPSAVTRDYVFDLQERDGGAPLLNIFGGKLTTYRRLAERALARLKPFFPDMGAAWTESGPLPGGDMPSGGPGGDFPRFLSALEKDFPGLDKVWLLGLAHRHGTRARDILDEIETPDGLGRDFGGGLFQREADYLIEREWAETADDILWRRTKCGLAMTEKERNALADYVDSATASMRSG
ncbi:MAG: glycerol-3-phosphate dehydrogenase [Rhodospirillales bacterium]|nr:glycerol-3-phosphate dehydrogenase [Alphaproteobacteria bacterium]MBL6948660.1 glycerol-3-phosphate dehydrogenase [Rhodospirillales bacterium]